LAEGVDEEAVLGWPDDLAHRAAPSCHDRGPARHRLDDAVAERLVEVDQVRERPRGAGQVRAAVGPDGADVGHAGAVETRFDEALEVASILDDPGDRERQAYARGDVDRLRGSLVWMNPAEEQEVLARLAP